MGASSVSELTVWADTLSYLAAARTVLAPARTTPARLPGARPGVRPMRRKGLRHPKAEALHQLILETARAT